MNRIVLIGNGFDLAHGLETGYGDFMADYWQGFMLKTVSAQEEMIGSINVAPKDELVKFKMEDQIYVMGHSCGNSDRTLLNTLFEHDNCVSIKVFYHREESGKDNFEDVKINISKCFDDKAKMRNRMVVRENCEPLSGE